MSYIIGNKCVSVCDAACTKVCPVDCIHGPILSTNNGKELKDMTKEELKEQQLYINPNDCIDCGACLPECPVDAIYPSEEWAEKENDTISVHKNYEFFGLTYHKRKGV
jgi:NAD-dependent dihydropyrimidine dehydrogenase PreA subunit